MELVIFEVVWKVRDVVKHTLEFLPSRKQSKKSLLSSAKSKVLTTASDFQICNFQCEMEVAVCI